MLENENFSSIFVSFDEFLGIFLCILSIDIWAARPRPSRAEFPIFTSFTNFFTKTQLHLIKVLNP